MQLQDILFSQGFGTRRVCVGMVELGLVRIAGQICPDAYADYATADLVFEVRETPQSEIWQKWPFHEKAYVMLYKPSGYEVSQKPSAWPSIYQLLPAPLRQRSGGKLQAVGRLDQDTTGLLLLSDDGQFIHRMASPKKQVEKIYRVGCAHPVDASQIQKLLAGVALHEEGKRHSDVVKASSCVQVGECEIDLGLTQGKYHQVKRMLAAVGNRVDRLHRSRIGGLSLAVDFLPSSWKFLDSIELNALNQ